MLFRLLLPLSLLISRGTCTTTKLQWGACNKTEVSGPLPVECSAIDVPLDYTEPNCNKTLNLELLRVPSLKKPSRGSILVNFGGPGLTARKDLASLGLTLQA